jgi:hypothetical protein
MKDLRNIPNLPRGLRNNNPGNLIKTSSNWQGSVPGNDSRFVTFINVHYGLRAKLYDIIKDIDKGQNTIRKLITEYAPPFENDTNAYIARVVKDTGVGADQPMNLTQDFLIKLSNSIMAVENGAVYKQYINDADIIAAINLLPTSLKKKLRSA